MKRWPYGSSHQYPYTNKFTYVFAFDNNNVIEYIHPALLGCLSLLYVMMLLFVFFLPSVFATLLCQFLLLFSFLFFFSFAISLFPFWHNFSTTWEFIYSFIFFSHFRSGEVQRNRSYDGCQQIDSLTINDR